MVALTAIEVPSDYGLRVATSSEDFASFEHLARAYRSWLGVDLRNIQNIEQEVAVIPSKYIAPSGCILLISHKAAEAGHASPSARGQDVACVAVRPLKQHKGEESYNSIADAAADPCHEKLTTAEPSQPSSSADGLSDGEQNDMAASEPDSNHQSICELKRLWVDEQHQSQGLGKVLISAAFEAAKQMGYQKVFLDCLKKLQAANKLYEESGFVQRKPYYYNPLPGKESVSARTTCCCWLYGTTTTTYRTAYIFH